MKRGFGLWLGSAATAKVAKSAIRGSLSSLTVDTFFNAMTTASSNAPSMRGRAASKSRLSSDSWRRFSSGMIGN